MVKVKPLERRGLLIVMADEADRRTRRLQLTEPSRTVLKAAVPVWEGTHADVERELEPTVASRLRTGLNALT